MVLFARFAVFSLPFSTSSIISVQIPCILISKYPLFDQLIFVLYSRIASITTSKAGTVTIHQPRVMA